MKNIWLKQQRQVYFIPTVYTAFFALLAILFMVVEEAVSMENLPNILVSNLQFAKAFYTLMIGSLLTIVTITFSTMMVVLTIYGAQFSPRTLQDFLSKKITLRILGYFLGTLMYAILGYFFLMNRQATYFISPGVGVLLFVGSVILFAYFIHYVSKSVQINLYIQTLVRETVEKIDAREQEIEDDKDVTYKSKEELEDLFEGKCTNVLAKNSGYIQHYALMKLFAFAKKHDCLIRTVKSVGEHVFEEEVVLELYNLSSLSEEQEKAIHEMMMIDDEINLYKDLGAGSRKLVEIALRALSPGINDPETASFCIEQTGYLLEKITTLLQPIVYIEGETIRLVSQKEDFTRILYDHFSQLKVYGFNDMSIIRSSLSALIRVAKTAGYYELDALWYFTEYLVNDLNMKEMHQYDYEYIITKLYAIAKLTNHLDEFKKSYSYGPVKQSQSQNKDKEIKEAE